MGVLLSQAHRASGASGWLAFGIDTKRPDIKREYEDAMRKPLAFAFVSAIGFVVSVAVVSPAGVRWRTGGEDCLRKTRTSWVDYASGTRIRGPEGDPDRAGIMCPIPNGQSFGTNSSTTKFVVRVVQDQAAGAITMRVRAHDDDSSSYCSCGSRTKTLGAGEDAGFGMTFDCGSCSNLDYWPLNLEIDTDGGGHTYIRRITVYD
jgi:hypothetical protein